MLVLILGILAQRGGSSGSSTPPNALLINGQPLLINGQYLTIG
jgi:hypothetical protein